MRSTSPSRDQPFGGDEDIARLYAALSWEASGGRKRYGIRFSMVLHAAALLPFFVGGVALPARTPIRNTAELTRLVLVPKTSSVKPRPSPPPSALPVPSNRALPEAPDAGSSELTVELSGISLGFDRDVLNQLPEVVKRYKGDLALLQKGDQDFAEYMFRGPSWTAVRGPTNIREKYLVLMEPAEEWRIFRELESGNGIESGKFLGAAVFDIEYRHCIMDAIRAKALSDHKSGGRVISARLAFTLDDPCGVVAKEVDVAPKSAR